jgi:hypothetical protein
LKSRTLEIECEGKQPSLRYWRSWPDPLPSPRSLKVASAIVAGLLFWGADARAGEGTPEESGAEHGLVLEIGPAAEWPLKGERANYGGNIAVEKEVIENGLEIELGVSGLGTSGRGELATDLLFKKPFSLSPTVEFMVGVGPEITRSLNGPDRGTTASAEFVLDFMFWPGGNVGWFVEPAATINGAGRKSLGLTGGLTFAFP